MMPTDVIALGILAATGVFLLFILARSWLDHFRGARALARATRIPPYPRARLWIRGPLRPPFVTLSIALLNLGVFLFFRLAGEGAKEAVALHFLTAGSIDPVSLTLAQFTHLTGPHLFSSLAALAFFGTIVENRLGPRRMAALYFAGGYLGLWSFCAFFQPRGIVIGASAGVSALIGAYAVLRISRARGSYVLPALFFFQYVFLDDLLGLHRGGDHVAYGGHIAGSIVGIGLAWAFARSSSVAAGSSSAIARAPLESRPKARA